MVSVGNFGNILTTISLAFTRYIIIICVFIKSQMNYSQNIGKMRIANPKQIVVLIVSLYLSWFKTCSMYYLTKVFQPVLLAYKMTLSNENPSLFGPPFLIHGKIVCSGNSTTEASSGELRCHWRATLGSYTRVCTRHLHALAWHHWSLCRLVFCHLYAIWSANTIT